MKHLKYLLLVSAITSLFLSVYVWFYKRIFYSLEDNHILDFISKNFYSNIFWPLLTVLLILVIIGVNRGNKKLSIEKILLILLSGIIGIFCVGIVINQLNILYGTFANYAGFSFIILILSLFIVPHFIKIKK